MSSQTIIQHVEMPVRAQRGDVTLQFHLTVECLQCLQSQKIVTHNKCFSRHMRGLVPQGSGLPASQDMLIPTAAIWRHTRSLLSSQCDSKSHHPYRAFIPTCQQMRAPYTCGNLRWRVYVVVCLCVPTEELAVQAYSQPAFLTSLMNLERTATCQLFLVLSCLHCSLTLFFSFLFSFLPLPPPSLFVCLNRRCLTHCGGFLPPSANKPPLSVLGTRITDSH